MQLHFGIYWLIVLPSAILLYLPATIRVSLVSNKKTENGRDKGREMAMASSSTVNLENDKDEVHLYLYCSCSCGLYCNYIWCLTWHDSHSARSAAFVLLHVHIVLHRVVGWTVVLVYIISGLNKWCFQPCCQTNSCVKRVISQSNSAHVSLF